VTFKKTVFPKENISKKVYAETYRGTITRAPKKMPFF
jgi:hypothetical protein